MERNNTCLCDAVSLHASLVLMKYLHIVGISILELHGADFREEKIIYCWD